MIRGIFQDILQNELQIVGEIPLRQMGSVVLGAGVHVEVNREPVFCFLPEGAVLPPEQAFIAMRDGLIDTLFRGGDGVDGRRQSPAAKQLHGVLEENNNVPDVVLLDIGRKISQGSVQDFPSVGQWRACKELLQVGKLSRWKGIETPEIIEERGVVFSGQQGVRQTADPIPSVQQRKEVTVVIDLEQALPKGL